LVLNAPHGIGCYDRPLPSGESLSASFSLAQDQAPLLLFFFFRGDHEREFVPAPFRCFRASVPERGFFLPPPPVGEEGEPDIDLASDNRPCPLCGLWSREQLAFFFSFFFWPENSQPFFPSAFRPKKIRCVYRLAYVHRRGSRFLSSVRGRIGEVGPLH